MTDRAARSSRWMILLLAFAAAWLVAQAATVDLDTALSGFNVNNAGSDDHHIYALANAGAWLAAVVGGAVLLCQRGRLRRALAGAMAGAAGGGVQLFAIPAIEQLLLDPALRHDVGSLAMRAGATAETSSLVAAISTAVLGALAAAIGFATGERGASLAGEVRQGGIAVAQSLRLSNFNVLSWFFGPVFQADVRVTGRRRITYIGRALYLLILLGILTIAWFGLRSDMDYYSGAERLRRMQELAPGLAQFLLWTQFILLMLIAPLLTAPVICQERTGRTLPALLTTPLTGAQVIFGKLAGRLTMAIVLILLSVPLLLGIRVYGGLDSAFVLKAVAITISATVLAASLGLLASIWSKRSTTAGVTAFIMLAAYSIGLPLLLAAIMFGVASQPQGWVFAISPVMTLGMLTAEANGSGPPFATSGMWLTNVGMNLGSAAFVCLVATFAFRRVMVAEAQGQTITLKRKRKRKRRQGPVAAAATPGALEVAAEASAAAEFAAAQSSSSDDDQLQERLSRQVGDRPVLWREVRQSTFGGGSKIRTVFLAAGAIGVVLLLNLYFGPREEGLHFVLLACGMILLCATAAVAATGTIAGEREAGAWTILLTTPLSGPEILLGKFLGSCRRCWVLPAMILLDSFIAIAAGAFTPVFLFHLALIIPATIIFLCGTGTLFSLLFRKLTTAGIANLILAVGLWLGVPMLFGFAQAIGDGWIDDLDWIFTGVVSISPVPMAVVSMAGAEDSNFAPYDMPSGNMEFAEFTALIIVSMGLTAGAGVLALALATVRFRFISERTS